MTNSSYEKFKPIPISIKGVKDWRFSLRKLVDLQLERVSQVVIPFMSQAQGQVLDVGAGQMPWRFWVPNPDQYQALDIESAGDFGMVSSDRITYYDGSKMPFADCSFSNVLCSEVIEHAEDPRLLISECFRVLEPKGKFCLTVPWSARMHHMPYDYHRFTIPQIHRLFSQSGFEDVKITTYGNTFSVIFNKAIIEFVAEVQKLVSWSFIPVLLKLVSLLPLIIIAWLLHLVTDKNKNQSDPLGFCVLAYRSEKADGYD